MDGRGRTDMQEKMKARLRESRLLAPSGRGREFTQPSLRLFLHICRAYNAQLTPEICGQMKDDLSIVFRSVREGDEKAATNIGADREGY